MTRYNELGQPIGAALENWQRRPAPERVKLAGTYCTLEPLESKHFDSLVEAEALDPSGQMWTYLPVGPFESDSAFRDYLARCSASADPLHFAVLDVSGRAVGTVSLADINPEMGVVEMGWVTYTPLLQRTVAATEAQFLLMKYVFDDLGYRRYQWKCDSLNMPSRRAAKRLGFKFEGIFRNATIYKGRTRDSAWFSIIDSEWADLRESFEKWLAPENFDAQGHQRASLASFRGHEDNAG